MGAGDGLSGQAGEARDLAEPFLDLPEELKGALRVFGGRLRVQAGEARQAGGPVVDVRVVLHRARTEREAAGVGRDVEFAELRVVGLQFGEGEGRQADGALAEQGGRDFGEGLRAGGLAVEAFEEGDELVGVGGGLEAAEGDLQQGAVAGGTSGDVYAHVQAGGAALGDDGGGGLGEHQAELVPEGLVGVADLEARDVVQLGGGAAGLVATGDAGGGHTGFAAGEDGGAGDGGDEGLVGADVGRGLVLADVLLAGGHHHHDAITAGVVLGLADETSGGLADFVLLVGVVADGEDAEAGAAEVGADGEVLAFADEDVGAFLAILRGSLEAAGGEEHRVDDGDGLHARVGAGVGQGVDVLKEAEGVDLREDDGGELLAEAGGGGGDAGGREATGRVLGGEEFQLHRSVGDVRAQDFEVGRQEVAGHEHGVGFGVGHAHGADGGFEERAGAFVERGVDGFEAGQLGERGLVDPVRDQRALRALGLVRRVRGREVADRADVTDDLMRAVDLQAVAEEAGLDRVLLRERFHAVGQGLVGEFVGQVLRAGELHRAVDVRVHVREVLRADGGEHRLDVCLGRRDVMAGEFARDLGRIVGQLGHRVDDGF